MRLFVYGSLLSGEDHHALLRGSRKLGDCLTAPRYVLIDLGDYPALLEEGTRSVRGEVYEVDASTLAALDEFEGHPSLYERTVVELATGEIGHGNAVAYVLRQKGLAQGRAEIASGDWRSRKSCRSRQSRE